MRTNTIRERAYTYLKNHPSEWVNGGELERVGMSAGYKGSTVSRELRRLAEESNLHELRRGGYIEREERDGERVRSVWYRWMADKEGVPHILKPVFVTLPDGTKAVRMV